MNTERPTNRKFMWKSTLSSWLVVMTILALFIAGCTGPSVTLIYHGVTLIYHGDWLRTESDSDGIWQMTPDGRDVVQLTSAGWYGEYSPDNSKIAYSEPYDNGVWAVNADGTNPVQLTTFGSSPSWSPDGSRLVFHVGGVKGTDRYLWIMNADGTDAHQLSTVNGSFADWSPLGDKIIFHGEVNNGIWSIGPDGSNAMLFYRQGGYPAWSPDGKQIAYVDLVDWCIWVMDADGQNKRKLTDHGGLQPAWSPDGLQIAYEGSNLSKDKDKKKTVIWMINSDGSDDHMINEGGRHPDWSN